MMKRMRNVWVSLVGGSLLALGLVSCGTPGAHYGAVKLFNGKDLNDWKHVSAEPGTPLAQVWSVQNGILTCQGKPLGALYRGPEVTNFVLTLEYRWPAGSEPGNSGIFSRISEPVTPLPRAVEVQLKHGNAGDVMGLQGKPIAGGQPRFFEVKKHEVAGDIAGVRKLVDAEKPPGQWNRVVVQALGSNYKVWMNGQLVNDVEGVEVLGGPVGVQSEGGVVQFRRITLVPLP